MTVRHLLSRSQKFKGDNTMQADFSSEEWAVRCDLAAAYRMFAHWDWDDLIYTAREPRSDPPTTRPIRPASSYIQRFITAAKTQTA